MSDSGQSALSLIIVLILAGVFIVVLLEIFVAKLKSINIDLKWSMKASIPPQTETACMDRDGVDAYFDHHVAPIVSK